VPIAFAVTLVGLWARGRVWPRSRYIRGGSSGLRVSQVGSVSVATGPKPPSVRVVLRRPEVKSMSAAPEPPLARRELSSLLGRLPRRSRSDETLDPPPPPPGGWGRVPLGQCLNVNVSPPPPAVAMMRRYFRDFLKLIYHATDPGCYLSAVRRSCSAVITLRRGPAAQTGAWYAVASHGQRRAPHSARTK
jgi:hypothetical protein